MLSWWDKVRDNTAIENSFWPAEEDEDEDRGGPDDGVQQVPIK